MFNCKLSDTWEPREIDNLWAMSLWNETKDASNVTPPTCRHPPGLWSIPVINLLPPLIFLSLAFSFRVVPVMVSSTLQPWVGTWSVPPVWAYWPEICPRMSTAGSHSSSVSLGASAQWCWCRGGRIALPVKTVRGLHSFLAQWSMPRQTGHPGTPHHTVCEPQFF